MTMLDSQPEGQSTVNLNLLAQIQKQDSENWFPYLHTGAVDLLDFYVMGMTGELGEFCNVLKKIDRLDAKIAWTEEHHPDHTDDLELMIEEIMRLREQAKAEHTDILCYWALVGQILGHDLDAEWRANRHRNGTRWGADSGSS